MSAATTTTAQADPNKTAKCRYCIEPINPKARICNACDRRQSRALDFFVLVGSISGGVTFFLAAFAFLANSVPPTLRSLLALDASILDVELHSRGNGRVVVQNRGARDIYLDELHLYIPNADEPIHSSSRNLNTRVEPQAIEEVILPALRDVGDEHRFPHIDGPGEPFELSMEDWLTLSAGPVSHCFSYELEGAGRAGYDVVSNAMDLEGNRLISIPNEVFLIYYSGGLRSIQRLEIDTRAILIERQSSDCDGMFNRLARDGEIGPFPP